MGACRRAGRRPGGCVITLPRRRAHASRRLAMSRCVLYQGMSDFRLLRFAGLPARPPPPQRRRTLLPGFDIPGRTIGVRDARPCPRETQRRGRRMSKKKADHATDELIERMLSHLEERRRRGDGAYPPTLEELATLCEIPPTSPQLAKAAKSKAFTTRAVVASKGKLLPEAPVVLIDHAADEAVVWRCASSPGRVPRKGERARPPRSPSSGTGSRRPCTSPSRRGRRGSSRAGSCRASSPCWPRG